jgi:predicted dienelactone hydrolase
MYARKFVTAVILCLATTLAHGAGLRAIEIQADAGGPALTGAVWYPCSQPSGEVEIGKIPLPGTKDCPLPDGKSPLIVMSHGRTGSLAGHHDIAEVLADAGFIVAAINHAGDTSADLSRTDDLSIYVQRPNDIKRLVDFMLGKRLIDLMLGTPAFASHIDPERVGLFGFSRGGYTALAVIGANPDWANVTERCKEFKTHVCDQVRAKEFPGSVTHDPRVKAAVIADPLSVFFTDNSFGDVRIPVQLWASEFGGDGVLPHSVDIVDKNLAAKHEYHVVANSGHFAFLAPCPPALVAELPRICADANGFDRTAFHKKFNADALAFFQAQLAKAPQ